MEYGKHLNTKKLLVFLSIFVILFVIIFASALLTSKAKNSKQKKAESNNKGQSEVVSKNETQEENVVSNEVVTNTSENENNQVENDTTSKNETKPENENTQKPSGSSSSSTSGKKLPVSNPDSIQLCKQAQSGDEKNIYLTFDDGPSPNITPQVLKVLKQYDVPATFFVLGSRVELYPELVKQEYNEGNYIANHGYSHKYSSIYSSEQAVIDEYNTTETAIQNALGIPEYHSYLFRFPGGSSGGTYHNLKQSAKSKLESMGIASTNWNCLTGDAEAVGRTKDQLLSRLYETAEGWTSLVVLMHDANDKQATVDALPEIIEHYKNEGYTFKNYYDIFQ